MNFFKKSISYLVIFLFVFGLIIPKYVKAAPYENDIQFSSGVYAVDSVMPKMIINDFNSAEQAAQWKAGVNTSQVSYATSIANGPGQPYEGSGCLEEVPEKVKVYQWRTIYTDYTQPINLSGSKYLALAANCWGWQNTDYIIKLTLFNGTKSYPINIKIVPNSWKLYAIDLSNVDAEIKGNVTRMEISFLNNFDLEGVAPGQPGYDYWDGRFQIDYLCTADALDMHFSADTEGFTTKFGKISASNSILTYDIEHRGSYLLSPIINKDASNLNSIIVTMKNSSTADKIKVSWITDSDNDWDKNKSKIFNINKDSFQKDYYLNFSDNLGWNGTIKQFKLEPINNGDLNGTMEIDQIKFDLLEKIIDYPGSINSCLINDKHDIEITASLEQDVHSDKGKKIALFELKPYENTDSILNKKPIDEKAISKFINFSIPLNDGQLDSRLNSKFVIALDKGNNSYEVLSNCSYITNPEKLAKYNYAFPQIKDKKGVQIYDQMLADVEELGVQHAAYNIPYNGMLYKDNGIPNNTISYQYNGKTYYFIKNRVESIDSALKSLTDKNIIVSAILIAYKTNNTTTADADIIHPDAENNGTVYAFNTKNETGTDYIQAITSFLAERYSRDDKQYGRIVNWIVGNEVGQNKVWNNMGPKLFPEYVDEYARTLRIVSNTIKSVYSNARIYISLDHFWKAGISPDSTWSYDNKKLIDCLNQHVIKEGNFGWDVAFHPYPENLFEPSFWNDKTATVDFNTMRITFKNIELLPEYLKQQDLLYNGNQRRIILSEQGFHSKDNSLDNQKLQAAAYAYAYYKVKFLDGIDSFILHRHVDHAGEGGLNLGLWTYKPGTITDSNYKKYIYNVFKYIDTEKSSAVSDFAKPIIGIGNWQEVIPNFDSSKLADRPAEAAAAVGVVANETNENIIDDFESNNGGWAAAQYVNSLVLSSRDKAAGNGSLEATITNCDSNDYKGIKRTFSSAQDFTNNPFLFMDIKTNNVPGSRATVKLRVLSGQNVCENQVDIDAAKWNRVGIDLSQWICRDKVDGIEVWVKQSSDNPWGSGKYYIDNFGTASTADLSNLNLIFSKPDKVQVGSTLHITISNNGNRAVNTNAAISGFNGLVLDKSSIPLTIEVGASADMDINIEAMNIEKYKKGQLQLTIDGNNYIFDVTDINIPPVIDGDNKVIIGDFEYGEEGWQADTNINTITAKPAAECFGLAPGSAVSGKNVLEIIMNGVQATDYKVVKKVFENPIDLSKSDVFRYSINSWGSPAAKYTTKLMLEDSKGNTFEQEANCDANKWNNMEFDISGCTFKDDIKAVKIGFKSSDWSDPWAGHFFLDNIYSFAKNYNVGDFEYTTDNWSAGVNVTGVSITSGGGLGDPGKAVSGSKYLKADCGLHLCTDYKTVVKQFEKPVDLSYYNMMEYSIQCYGGVPGAEGYITVLRLYDNNGNMYEKENKISSDIWNNIKQDISDCSFRDAVTKIEIGFKSNGGTINWNPEFYLDSIAFKTE